MTKKKVIIFILLIGFVYVLGIFTSVYKMKPYTLVKDITTHLANRNKNSSELDLNFIDPLINTTELKYKAIENSQQIFERIDKYQVRIDSFDFIYDKIVILSTHLEGNIFTLAYQCNNKLDTLYAYYKPTISRNSKVGINIIPGSGINQSSAIYFNNDQNKYYQSNIDDLTIKYGDTYVLVKPNEDFLAIHNGKLKIGSDLYINYLLNKGTSYSGYYLQQSLALSKYIKQTYKKLFVCGLSQGGLAALVNSLQSQPDKAVIASGFSILMEYPYRSAHDQIILPNLILLHDANLIKLKIRGQKTEYLFLWGEKETGLYGREAKEGLTRKFFEELGNVQTVVHPDGHVYYEPAINAFLTSN